MEYNRILKETSAYNDIARSNQQQDIRQLTNTLVGEELIARFEQKALIEDFPDPALLWIDSRASPVSQLEAYRWLSPVGCPLLRAGDFFSLVGLGLTPSRP